MLFLGGAYLTGPKLPALRCVVPPISAQLQGLAHRIAEWIGLSPTVL